MEVLGITQRHGGEADVENCKRCYLSTEHGSIVVERAEGGRQVIARIKSVMFGVCKQGQGTLGLLRQPFGGDPQGAEIVEPIEAQDRVALLLGNPDRAFGTAQFVQNR